MYPFSFCFIKIFLSCIFINLLVLVLKRLLSYHYRFFFNNRKNRFFSLNIFISSFTSALTFFMSPCFEIYIFLLSLRFIFISLHYVVHRILSFRLYRIFPFLFNIFLSSPVLTVTLFLCSFLFSFFLDLSVLVVSFTRMLFKLIDPTGSLDSPFCLRVVCSVPSSSSGSFVPFQ